ncbi:hypothetical protein [Shewanella sp.]|uniref:hypothetical protein n=1 Tax=Shewanella sp. TaxID=50422 RepID=UPI003F3E3322
MANPFVPDSRLTAIALGFRNAGFIADLVAPRVDVPTASFRWTEYKAEDTFTIPNTLVGRKGIPGKVEFSSSEKTDSVVDYGLSDDIPQEDIDKAAGHPSFYDPEGRAAMKLAELVALDREKRVSSLVMAAGSYDNKEVITGTDKWTDAASKPIEQITDAMASLLVTPNLLVLGKLEALALRRNAQILKAFHGNTSTDGLVPLEFIRELFGLERIMVGESRYNTARNGQPMALSNLWGGGVSLIYTKPAAQLQDDITFLLTAQWQGRVATRNIKPAGQLGLRGGVEVVVGESVKEVLVSKASGYLLQGVV